MYKPKSAPSNQTISGSSKNISWGFKIFSEKINGRVAMIGFVFLLLIEIITKSKIL